MEPWALLSIITILNFWGMYGSVIPVFNIDPSRTPTERFVGSLNVVGLASALEPYMFREIASESPSDGLGSNPRAPIDEILHKVVDEFAQSRNLTLPQVPTTGASTMGYATESSLTGFLKEQGGKICSQLGLPSWALGTAWVTVIIIAWVFIDRKSYRRTPKNDPTSNIDSKIYEALSKAFSNPRLIDHLSNVEKSGEVPSIPETGPLLENHISHKRFTQLEDLTKSLDVKVQSFEKINAIESQLKALQLQVSGIQKESDKDGGIHERLTQLEGQVKSLNANSKSPEESSQIILPVENNEAMENQLKALEEQLSTNRKEFETSIASLKNDNVCERLIKLEALVKSLNVKPQPSGENSQSNLPVERIHTLEDQSKALKKQLDESETTISNMKETIGQELYQRFESTILQDSNVDENVKHQVEQLKIQFTKFQKDNEDTKQAAKSMIDGFEKKLERLKESLRSVDDKHKDIELDQSSVVEKIQELEKDMKAINESIKTNPEDEQDGSRSIPSLRTDVDNLQDRLNEIDQNRGAYVTQDQWNELTSSKTVGNDDTQKLNQLIDSIKTELLNDIESVRAQISRSDGLENVASEMKSVCSDLEAMKASNTTIEERLNKIHEQGKDQGEKFETTQKSFEAQQLTIEKLNQTANKFTNHVETFQKENVIFTRRLDHIQDTTSSHGPELIKVNKKLWSMENTARRHNSEISAIMNKLEMPYKMRGSEEAEVQTSPTTTSSQPAGEQILSNGNVETSAAVEKPSSSESQNADADKEVTSPGAFVPSESNETVDNQPPAPVEKTPNTTTQTTGTDIADVTAPNAPTNAAIEKEPGTVTQKNNEPTPENKSAPTGPAAPTPSSSAAPAPAPTPDAADTPAAATSAAAPTPAARNTNGNHFNEAVRRSPPSASQFASSHRRDSKTANSPTNSGSRKSSKASAKSAGRPARNPIGTPSPNSPVAVATWNQYATNTADREKREVEQQMAEKEKLQKEGKHEPPSLPEFTMNWTPLKGLGIEESVSPQEIGTEKGSQPQRVEVDTASSDVPPVTKKQREGKTEGAAVNGEKTKNDQPPPPAKTQELKPSDHSIIDNKAASTKQQAPKNKPDHAPSSSEAPPASDKKTAQKNSPKPGDNTSTNGTSTNGTSTNGKPVTPEVPSPKENGMGKKSGSATPKFDWADDLPEPSKSSSEQKQSQSIGLGDSRWARQSPVPLTPTGPRNQNTRRPQGLYTPPGRRESGAVVESGNTSSRNSNRGGGGRGNKGRK